MQDYSGSIIKNRIELITGPAREKAVAILEAGIISVLPSSIMHSSVRYLPGKHVLSIRGEDFDLTRGRVFVIGGGKASGAMAGSFEDILGVKNIKAGIVTDKYGVVDHHTKKIIVQEAGHPVPDEKGVQAVQAMLRLKPQYNISQDDIVVCLISGGGSALLPYPVDSVSLENKQRVTGLLLECGADISEINCVRKHLSQVKGGRLGRYFSPATVISLILSDVIGNDLGVIASGPTYPDRSTFSQALAVLAKYNLVARMPESTVDYLQQGALGLVDETPKTLSNCHNFIIGDNSLALAAMKDKAVQFGLKPLIIATEQKGETCIVARKRVKELLAGKYAGFDTLLIGGETTPRLPPTHGQGGRNQHYTAASLLAMRDYSDHWLIASIGTDGSDFMSDVAGAIVDDSTLAWFNDRGIAIKSYIDNYDSYGLLSEVPGSIIKTGNTGTNVGDIMVYLLA